MLLGRFHDTAFQGDASRGEKQQTLYYQFVTLPYDSSDAYAGPPVNTIASGRSTPWEFGHCARSEKPNRPNGPLASIGNATKRSIRRHTSTPLAILPSTATSSGIPRSSMNDIGVLTNIVLPVNKRFTLTAGGRVDYAQPSLDQNDPVITQTSNPASWYYDPGTFRTGAGAGDGLRVREVKGDRSLYVEFRHRIRDAHADP